jgi:hypothetical protein
VHVAHVAVLGPHSGAGAGLDARIAALADARTPNSPSDAGAPTDARSPTDAPPPAIPVTTRELTDGWMDAVFGPTTRNGPTKPGAAVVTGNRMKVTGYGSGLVGKEQLGRESFYFLWKPLVGDGEVSAKIVSSTHEHSADVGVMIRAGLTPMSFHGMAGVQPTDDTVDVYSAAHFRRYEISTAGVLPRLTKGLRLPLWVKAVRSGQTITAYVSTDGTAWRSLGAQTYQDFPREAYAGIAVMSGWTRATAPTTAELEDVSLVQR